jgi:hypothetical protein
LQTGDTIPAQTYYNAETAKISLPDDSSSTVSIWVVVVIAIVAFIALVLAIAFGVKYVQMKKLVGGEDRARLLPFGH